MEYKLSAFVDEIISMSSLPPRITEFYRNKVVQHLDDNVLSQSNNYPLIASELYGFNDEIMYSIVSLSFVNDYMFFLIRKDDLVMKKPTIETINFIKNNYDYAGVDLGNIIKDVHAVKDELQNIIESSKRTTRKATGSNVKEVELPDMSVMKEYYECGRKVSYDSLDLTEGKLSGANEVYVCEHCGKYHQGKKPTGMNVPKDIMEGRYRTAWRRYHKV
jgi:hypothetical protein